MTKTTVGTTVQNLPGEVRQALRNANPFLEKFARFGYAAKGAVYCIVGIMAAMAAFGAAGGQTTGSEGAMYTLFRQPFGKVLLAILAAGLAGYSTWQFIRAIEDPENEGTDGKAIVKRISFFLSGVVHFGLVLAAIQLLFQGHGGRSGDAGAQHWTATVMSYPLGQWLVGICGAGIICYGLSQLARAWSAAKVQKRLMISELPTKARQWVMRISRFGLASRGVVFTMVGGFLILAAWRENPSEARGLGGALQALQRQPYGWALLAIVAIGLVAYGIFQFVQARYRHIKPHSAKI